MDGRRKEEGVVLKDRYSQEIYLGAILTTLGGAH